MRITLELTAGEMAVLLPSLQAMQEAEGRLLETKAQERTAPAAPAAPAAAPPAPEAKAEEPKAAKAEVPFELVTIEDVKKVLQTKPNARQTAMEILKKMGKQKITDLQESELCQFMVDLGAADGCSDGGQ